MSFRPGFKKLGKTWLEMESTSSWRKIYFSNRRWYLLLVLMLTMVVYMVLYVSNVSMVYTFKLALAAVNITKWDLATVNTTKLNASTVHTNKLETSTVHATSDLATGETTKLYSATVQTTKLDSATVQTTKLDSATVQRTKLDSATVQTTKLDSTAVQTTKLDSAKVQTTKLDSTAVHTSKAAVNQTTPSSTLLPQPCWGNFKEVFDREKRFICLAVENGLGNAMFQFASIYGIATKVNKTVVIQKNNPLLKLFSLKAQVVCDLKVCNSATRVTEKKDCSFDKSMFDLKESRNYFLSQYFQSWMYFRHVEDDIRHQFTFKESLRQKALSLIKDKQQLFLKHSNHSNLTESPATVSVHVRRGDITTKRVYVQFGYLAAPATYFQNAMAYFRQKYKHPLFLVCSDDMSWSKANIQGSDVMYMEGHSRDEDMVVMSHCDHTIMSVGSFGWWVAFLAHGETIYYKHPVRNGSNLRNEFSEDFNDYFYPSWTAMD